MSLKDHAKRKIIAKTVSHESFLVQWLSFFETLSNGIMSRINNMQNHEENVKLKKKSIKGLLQLHYNCSMLTYIHS